MMSRCGFICEWDTANRGARVEDVVEEREEPQLEEPEEEAEPSFASTLPQEQISAAFSLDDDPSWKKPTCQPLTDPEGILDRAWTL